MLKANKVSTVQAQILPKNSELMLITMIIMNALTIMIKWTEIPHMHYAHLIQQDEEVLEGKISWTSHKSTRSSSIIKI